MQAHNFIDRAKEMVGASPAMPPPVDDQPFEKEFDECLRKIQSESRKMCEEADEARGFLSYIPDDLKEFNIQEEKRLNDFERMTVFLQECITDLKDKLTESKYFEKYTIPKGELKTGDKKEERYYEIKMELPHFDKKDIEIKVERDDASFNGIVIKATKTIHQDEEAENQTHQKEFSGKIEQKITLSPFTYLKSFFRNVEKGKGRLNITYRNNKLEIKAVHEFPSWMRTELKDDLIERSQVIFTENVLFIHFPLSGNQDLNTQKKEDVTLKIR